MSSHSMTYLGNETEKTSVIVYSVASPFCYVTMAAPKLII